MSDVALTVGGTPVKSVYVGSTPVKAVYVGSTLVWQDREVVQITLGTSSQARDQFRAALTARGLDYATVTELPFEIELVGSGSAQLMFYGCRELTSVPPLDTSQVTNMNGFFQECRSLVTVPPLDTSNVTNAPQMFAYCRSLVSAPAMDTSQMTNMRNMFNGCSSLTSVSDMDTSQVADMGYMFSGCAALTDGNVRLIGRHPNVDTTGMILNSGLTREPWYKADGTPDDGTAIEVHEVTITNATGTNTVHPLVAVTVPAGETWNVRIQGTITKAASGNAYQPSFRIGATNSGKYGQGAAVDFSGTITAANSTIALVSNDFAGASFTGTVTIEK